MFRCVVLTLLLAPSAAVAGILVDHPTGVGPATPGVAGGEGARATPREHASPHGVPSTVDPTPACGAVTSSSG